MKIPATILLIALSLATCPAAEPQQLSDPPGFAQAIDLFQGRRYAEARTAFAQLKARPVQNLSESGDPATLAAFYEMECLRKLGDLDGLAAALRGFSKANLVRESQRAQVDLYILWDAVRTKDWKRVDELATARAIDRMPDFLRAQTAYCHGLALEALGRPDAALDAYQTAVTADAGASEDVTRSAALGILRIHLADPAVQLAIKQWATPALEHNPHGRARLAEAAAVACLYQLSLGAGTTLPAEFKHFLKYQPAAATPIPLDSNPAAPKNSSSPTH